MPLIIVSQQCYRQLYFGVKLHCFATANHQNSNIGIFQILWSVNGGPLQAYGSVAFSEGLSSYVLEVPLSDFNNGETDVKCIVSGTSYDVAKRVFLIGRIF